MEKLLRKTKRFGRCPSHGHGNCEVSFDIEDVEFTRTKEKVIINKRINEDVKEFYETLCTCN